jgi:iron complex outermembrane receptor protein
MKLGALALGTSAFALILGAGASAQTAASSDDGAVQEIVVTAQKRSEKIQDVPIAVTAVTGEEIANKRIADIVDLSSQVPGLQISAGDNGANPHIFIRGVGVNDFNLTTATAIGIYADGAYLASPLSQRSAFFDLQQVEVLRGPQGTLYGRNTTGGAINILSRKPTDEWTGNVSLDYGRFNSSKLEGGVGGPITTDVLSFRLAGIFEGDDGYMYNRLTNKDVNGANHWAFRGALRFTPSSDVTDDLIVTVDHSQGDSILGYNRTLLDPKGNLCTGNYTSGKCTNAVGYANTSSNLYAGDYRFVGKDKVRFYGLTNNLTVDLGAASIVSITAYQHVQRRDREETDIDPLPMLDTLFISGQNTFSEELRLQSSGETDLHYVAGLYYANDIMSNASRYNVEIADQVLGWPFHQTTDSYAAFSQADYQITDALTLTGGLRYSYDDKHFVYDSIEMLSNTTFFHIDQSKGFSSISGRAGIAYRLSPTANLYATYNRGTKSGGFFGGQTTDARDIGPYRDETVDAYEVGAKTEWFDRKLTADLAAFYYDYQDLQVYTLVKRPPIDAQVFTNASAARIYGAEFELSAHPVRGLDLSLDTSLLSAKYVNFVSAAASADYSGNTLPFAPTVSIQANAHYEHDIPVGTLVGDVSLTYRSHIFFDTTDTPRVSDPGRAYVDTRLGVRFGENHYEAGLWCKNIFDEPSIGLIGPIPSLGYDFYTINPPRTYGLYLRAEF